MKSGKIVLINYTRKFEKIVKKTLKKKELTLTLNTSKTPHAIGNWIRYSQYSGLSILAGFKFPESVWLNLRFINRKFQLKSLDLSKSIRI